MSKLFEKLMKGLEDIAAHKKNKLDLRTTTIEISDIASKPKKRRDSSTSKKTLNKVHVPLSIEIPSGLHRRLQEEASECGISFNSLIIEKLAR